MEEKPGKRNWYVAATCLSLLLVGAAVGVSTEGWGKYILELEQGKPYRLKLASLDMKHTLAIRGLHLFNGIALGELATIKFSPEKSGRFTLQCGYFCGPWHDGMIGAVIVVPSRM